MNEVVAWCAWLRDVRRVRGSTLDAYGRTLDAFQEWLGHGNWEDVDAPTIERFMGRPRRGGIIGSPATQDRDRAAISLFYKWLMSRGKVSMTPLIDVGVPRVRNRMPRAIPDELWVQLWGSRLADDDRLWLGLGCFAGLRRREIVSVAPQQVDGKRGLLLFLERKGGNEDAVEYAQMARVVADGLPSLLPDPERWIDIIGTSAEQREGERCLITMDAPATATTLARASFTDPRLPDPAVVNKRLKQVLRSVGLPADAFTPHALRHSCVTNMLRCGVPIEVVSDIVGHADIDTTRRYVKSSGRLADWRTRFAGSHPL